jgi:hypothetical protein
MDRFPCGDVHPSAVRYYFLERIQEQNTMSGMLIIPELFSSRNERRDSVHTRINYSVAAMQKRRLERPIEQSIGVAIRIHLAKWRMQLAI